MTVPPAFLFPSLPSGATFTFGEGLQAPSYLVPFSQDLCMEHFSLLGKFFPLSCPSRPLPQEGIPKTLGPDTFHLWHPVLFLPGTLLKQNLRKVSNYGLLSLPLLELKFRVNTGHSDFFATVPHLPPTPLV